MWTKCEWRTALLFTVLVAAGCGGSSAQNDAGATGSGGSGGSGGRGGSGGGGAGDAGTTGPSLTISDGPLFDFQATAMGATAEHTFTVTNGGGMPATMLRAAAAPAAPFAFKGGGAFPGTGGTCT